MIYQKEKKLQLMSIGGPASMACKLRKENGVPWTSVFSFSFAFCLKTGLQLTLPRRHPRNSTELFFFQFYPNLGHCYLSKNQSIHICINTSLSSMNWKHLQIAEDETAYIQLTGSSMHLAKEFHKYLSAGSVPYLASLLGDLTALLLLG